MVTNDLHVNQISSALQNTHIDLVVSGSIGAVESVRFVRALRRLGAEVHPYLTQGAQLFTTPTAISWAAARQAVLAFDGAASHLALRDACVVAPASANFIAKVAQGITDSPATALVASYLGQKKPVYFVPNMHDSLILSPFVASNIDKLKTFAQFLEPRIEEGKQKFPDPAMLADIVSHELNAHNKRHKILLTMGTTRGYIDSVRYISNYSSGALGTKISEEFYRQGYYTKVVTGPCQYQPRAASELIQVDTHEDMALAIQEANHQPLSGAIFAASVLDFTPEKRVDRKIRSSESLDVTFVKTSKIISLVNQSLAFKVGFKLETEMGQESKNIARSYLEKYHLSHLIMNQLSEVTETAHNALAYLPSSVEPKHLNSKTEIAHYLVQEAGKVLERSSTEK